MRKLIPHSDIRKSSIIALVLCVVLLFIASGLARSLISLVQKQRFITSRKDILVREQKENERLQKQLEEVQTPEFVEREARERLGLVKEGETIILMNKTNSQSINQEPRIMNNEPGSIWQKWWKLFF